MSPLQPMPDAVHYIIPFAHASTEACARALSTLKLPRLGALAARWALISADDGDDFSLSPPHERALAAAYGWTGAAGVMPFAAWSARRDGIDTGDLAWGLLTPAHWHVGRDHITLLDPESLALNDQESRDFLDAVRELFESEGFLVAFGATDRWYVAHESLANLPCASIDRVIGRNVDIWLPSGPQARLIRRLQNEVQMLLYRTPLNDDRLVRGQLSVNSFWLSGCGRHQPCGDAEVHVLDALRAPALQQDWEAWGQAWQSLDADALAGLASQSHVTLTLCGERGSVSLAHEGSASWRRWTSSLLQRWRSPSPEMLLGNL